MPFKLNRIREISRGLFLYEVVGDFPVTFREFFTQILCLEASRKTEEITFVLPGKSERERWGLRNDSVIHMTKENGAWWPCDDGFTEDLQNVQEELVVSCDAFGGFGFMSYNFKLAERNSATNLQEKTKPLKVKVRYTSDYTKYPKDRLVAMLSDRDRQIESLQSDLCNAREQEHLWKIQASKLAGENRSLKDQARKERGDGTPTNTLPEPERTTDAEKNRKKTAQRLIPGPSFHGESWYTCPHCGKGIEFYSLKETKSPKVYLCPWCKNKVTGA